MRSVLVLVTLLCMVACDRSAVATPVTKGPSPDEIQRRMLRISEAALAAKKSADGSALPWESLATMLPDTVGQLTADAPATGHLDLTGTQISKAKRSYTAHDQTAKIELMDVSRAPSVLLAFMLQRGAVQRPPVPDSDGTITNAETVGTYPALTRFSTSTQEAIVTIVIKQRFVIEVLLAKATSANDAMQVMSALPLGNVALLATTPVGPESASPVAPSASTSVIDNDDPDQP